MPTSRETARSPASRPPVYHSRNLQILLAATLASVMSVSAVAPAFPQIVRALDISRQQVGLLVTVLSVPGVVLTPFLGALADRIGRKRVLVPSMFLFGIAGTACAFTHDFDTLLALRVVQGIGRAPIVTLNVAVISDLFEDSQRTAAIGYNSAALNAGVALYPALGGALALMAWQAPFALAALSIPAGLVVMQYLDVPSSVGNTPLRTYVYRLRRVLAERKVIGLLLASLVFYALLFGVGLTYLPELMHVKFGANAFIIGLIVACASASTAVMSTQVERLARVVPKVWLIVGAFAISGLALAVFPLVPVVWELPIVAVVFGIGPGLSTTSVLTLLTERAPDGGRAAVISINSTVVRLGQALGPLLMGAVIAVAGVGAVFYAGALLAFAAMITVGLLIVR